MLCFDKFPKWLNGFIPIIFGLISFILSIVATSECKFIRRKDTTVPNFATVEYYGLFYKYVKDKGCEELVFSGKVPSAVQAARAFAVLAALFAGALLTVLLFQICVPFPKTLRLSLGVAYGIVFTFQMLTFTVFAYDELCDVKNIDCELGDDGYASLMAAIFHILCVVILCMVPDQKESIFKLLVMGFRDALEIKETDESAVKTADKSAKNSKQETITECVDADGNKTTTKVTIAFDESGNKTTTTETKNADGSIIVTTETEMV